MDDVVVDGISRTSRTTSSSFRAVLVSVGVGFTGFFFFLLGFFRPSGSQVPRLATGFSTVSLGFVCLFPGLSGFYRVLLGFSEL